MTALVASPSPATPSSDAEIRARLAEELAAPARRSVRLMGIIAIALFVILGLLCSLVPIASGALADGRLEVQGERKVVQHPSGGIVANILVKEGQTVKAGEVLVRLDGVQAGAAVGIVSSKLDALHAEEAVRLAEIKGLSKPEFPKDLTARSSNPAVAAMLANERSAFEARRSEAEAIGNRLGEQLQQAEATRHGAGEQLIAVRAQAELLRSEYASVQPLEAKGLVLRSRLLALQRSIAQADGQIAALESDIAAAEAKIRELRTQRAQVEVSRRADAADRLRVIRSELSQSSEQSVAANDTLQRTEVKAPIDGVVMAMRVATEGGVVSAGQPLMEIVPQSIGLVATVRVRPADADNVRAGQVAIVRLGASTRSPQVEGVVESISADALTDERTGISYFEARVTVPPEAAAKAPRDLIAPGLPAEVLIRTGAHTVLEYLFKPVEDAAFRSMRDS